MKKPATALIFVFLIVVYALFLIPKIAHVHRLNKQSQELEQELIKLRKQNQILEQQLKMLREDPVYLEKVARRKLNKAKPGEMVLELVDKDGDAVRKK